MLATAPKQDKPAPAPKFVPVRCQSCSKVFTHAAPGSTVRFRCRRCKCEQIVNV